MYTIAIMLTLSTFTSCEILEYLEEQDENVTETRSTGTSDNVNKGNPFEIGG